LRGGEGALSRERDGLGEEGEVTDVARVDASSEGEGSGGVTGEGHGIDGDASNINGVVEVDGVEEDVAAAARDGAAIAGASGISETIRSEVEEVAALSHRQLKEDSKDQDS